MISETRDIVVTMAAYEYSVIFSVCCCGSVSPLDHLIAYAFSRLWHDLLPLPHSLSKR